MDEDLLDDQAALLAADRPGLLRALATAGAQVRELSALGDEAGLARLAAGGPPRSLVLVIEPPAVAVAGLLVALADRRAGCPVVLQAVDAPLPNWVGASDLVVVAGLSQARERELALLAEAAARRGAALLGIGRAAGTLEERRTWARAPYVAVPRGHAEPTAFWSLATPILRLAGDLHLVEVDLAAVAAALDATAEVCRPDAESFVNPAKLLALQLAGSLPVLVADSAATAVVAELVRNALAGLAGLPSTVAVLPGETAQAVGYLSGPYAPGEDERDVFRDRVEQLGPALRLLSVSDGPQTGEAGRAALRELARRAEYAGVPVTDLAGEQPPWLPRLAGQLALGEFAAAYLRLGLGSGSRPLGTDLGPYPA